MTVNGPVALPLCSLTVVREPSKGREQAPFSEQAQEKLTRSGCYRSPQWCFADPAPWGVACVCLCVSGLGGAATFTTLALGLRNALAKRSTQRKSHSKAVIGYRAVLQHGEQCSLESSGTFKLPRFFPPWPRLWGPL